MQSPACMSGEILDSFTTLEYCGTSKRRIYQRDCKLTGSQKVEFCHLEERSDEKSLNFSR